MKASYLILSAALVLAGCQAPKLTGDQAREVLEACVFADKITALDYQERGEDGEFTSKMVDNLDEAAKACARVKAIDQTDFSDSTRACVQMYAYKADIYGYAKPVLVERNATPQVVREMKDLLSKMQDAERKCESGAVA